MRSTPTRTAKLTACILAAAALAIFAGCESDSVEVTDKNQPYAETQVKKPDFVMVDAFAVTPDEVKVMRGISPAIAQAFDDQTLTQEEVAIGHEVSTTLQKELVRELNERGIKTYATEQAPPTTFKTGVIKGFFCEVNQGDRTGRNLIGFGVGQSSISTRVLFNVREVNVASATVTTKAELKLGRLPVVAAIDEAMHGTIERDAKRVAKKIADEVEQAYRKRGWRS
ncbi:MAG: DUF4410 domain-containing protein [Planctomycetes bacterium]|nr:DUF4410 domain-containing protein [Planctomycetota bacterium]